MKQLNNKSKNFTKTIFSYDNVFMYLLKCNVVNRFKLIKKIVKMFKHDIKSIFLK